MLRVKVKPPWKHLPRRRQFTDLLARNYCTPAVGLQSSESLSSAARRTLSNTPQRSNARAALSCRVRSALQSRRHAAVPRPAPSPPLAGPAGGARATLGPRWRARGAAAPLGLLSARRDLQCAPPSSPPPLCSLPLSPLPLHWPGIILDALEDIAQNLTRREEKNRGTQFLRSAGTSKSGSQGVLR